MHHPARGFSKPVVIVLLVCIGGAAYHFSGRLRAPTGTAVAAPATPAAPQDGAIVVQPNPADADVKVGDLAPQKAPVALKGQKPGTYHVRVTRPDYEDWESDVTVAPGKVSELKPALVRSTGSVLISEPVGAEVYAGDSKLGEVPLKIASVPTGKVQYRIAAKGYAPQTVSGEVARNAELQLSARLEKWIGPEPDKTWMVPNLNITMLWVRPGPLRYRTNRYNDKTHRTDTVVATVEGPRGFWLGKTEIRQNQWVLLMKQNPSRFQGSDHPVENITYIQALDFCRKLTDYEKKAGRLPEGFRYSVPTPLEWRYACKAGAPTGVAKDFDRYAWYDENSGGRTHPAMAKSPNAWGLYDMYGNVAEWCAMTSLRGYACGGGWDSPTDDLGDPERSTGAPAYGPDHKSPSIGFRLVLSSQPEPRRDEQ